MLTRILPFLALAAFMAGCSSHVEPTSPQARHTLMDDGQTSLATMKAADPGLQHLLDTSYAYVIYPDVGAGGAIVGGAYGRGIVYEHGRFNGYADLSQASVGAVLGGQTYAELVVFRDRDSFWRLESSQLTFGAEASAVAIKSGAAASGQFVGGMIAFVQPHGGLMVDASLNGQQLHFVPAREAEASSD